MRFLHTSDWHLGKDLFSFSLIDDQRYYLEKFCELVTNEKVDAVIIAGDLYHRSVPSSEAVALLDETLNHLVNDLKIPVLAISGNHDSPERLSFGSRLYESSGLYLEGIPSKIIRRVRLEDTYGTIEIFLLPYLDPYKARALLGDPSIHTFDDAYRALLSLPENQPSKELRTILVAHGLFAKLDEQLLFSESERSIGGAELVNSTLFDDFDYVALGHLHAPQRAGRESMRYSGSILKYSLSEATQRKVVLLVDINEKSNISIEERKISPKRDLRILEGSLENILSANQNDSDTGDYVYAKLTDTMLYDAMGKLRALFPNAIGLSLDSEKSSSSYDASSIEQIKHLSIEEQFDAFFETMAGRKMKANENEVMKRIFSQLKEEM